MLFTPVKKKHIYIYIYIFFFHTIPYNIFSLFHAIIEQAQDIIFLYITINNQTILACTWKEGGLHENPFRFSSAVWNVIWWVFVMFDRGRIPWPGERSLLLCLVMFWTFATPFCRICTHWCTKRTLTETLWSDPCCTSECPLISLPTNENITLIQFQNYKTEKTVLKQFKNCMNMNILVFILAVQTFREHSILAFCRNCANVIFDCSLNVLNQEEHLKAI